MPADPPHKHADQLPAARHRTPAPAPPAGGGCSLLCSWLTERRPAGGGEVRVLKEVAGRPRCHHPDLSKLQQQRGQLAQLDGRHAAAGAQQHARPAGSGTRGGRPSVDGCEQRRRGRLLLLLLLWLFLLPLVRIVAGTLPSLLPSVCLPLWQGSWCLLQAHSSPAARAAQQAAPVHVLRRHGCCCSRHHCALLLLLLRRRRLLLLLPLSLLPVGLPPSQALVLSLQPLFVQCPAYACREGGAWINFQPDVRLARRPLTACSSMS